jgi:hypothetical protein
MPRPTLRLAAALAASFAAAPLVAQGAPTAAPTAQAAPTAPPRVWLRAPANGARIAGKVTVAFGLANYGVAPAGIDFPNTGHFHLLVDTEAPAPGTVIPTDAQHLHYGKGQIEATIDLPRGKHVLRAVLGDFQHRVISTELVSAPISITVR